MHWIGLALTVVHKNTSRSLGLITLTKVFDETKEHFPLCCTFFRCFVHFPVIFVHFSVIFVHFSLNFCTFFTIWKDYYLEALSAFAFLHRFDTAKIDKENSKASMRVRDGVFDVVVIFPTVALCVSCTGTLCN